MFIVFSVTFYMLYTIYELVDFIQKHKTPNKCLFLSWSNILFVGMANIRIVM